MSFSCGIVEVPKAHEETSPETILEEADRIMYQQKREHKKIYQEEMGSTPEKVILCGFSGKSKFF